MSKTLSLYKNIPILRLLLSLCLFLGLCLSGCGPLPGVATIDLSPPSLTIGVNQVQRFYATVYDSSHNIVTGRTVTWSVSGVGTVDTNGNYSAGATAGTAILTASTGDQSTTATITVTERGIVHGRLSDNDGLRLSNMYIDLNGLATLSATSNTTGDYSISGIPAGTYEVKTRESAIYLQATDIATVTAGSTILKNIVVPFRLSVTNENIDDTTSASSILISLKITNNGSTTAYGVTANYVFYADDGTVAGVGTTAPVTLATGQSASVSTFISLSPDVTVYSHVRTVSAASY